MRLVVVWLVVVTVPTCRHSTEGTCSALAAFAVDGSLKHAMFLELRVGGWAVVMAEGDQVRALFGSLSSPRPTSYLAELWSMLQAL